MPMLILIALLLLLQVIGGGSRGDSGLGVAGVLQGVVDLAVLGGFAQPLKKDAFVHAKMKRKKF